MEGFLIVTIVTPILTALVVLLVRHSKSRPKTHYYIEHFENVEILDKDGNPL
jgi:hypothetical protein